MRNRAVANATSTTKGDGDDGLAETSSSRTESIPASSRGNGNGSIMSVALPLQGEAAADGLIMTKMGNRRSYAWTAALIMTAFMIMGSFHWSNSIPPADIHHNQHGGRRMADTSSTFNNLKILYIVTSVAEFDTGKRKTVEGRDRFSETLVPVVSESVQSMLDKGYQVDVYLITHYTLTQHRRDQLRAALPSSTTPLEYWDDATPISYPKPSEGSQDRVVDVTRSLSRQHRFVIKDKFLEYNFFVAFEDDMLVTGTHVQQYIRVQSEIKRLRQAAPFRLPCLHEAPTRKQWTVAEALDDFYGDLSKIQLARMIPGFIRVERVPPKNATAFRIKRSRPGPIPAATTYLDPVFQVSKPLHVNPTTCCQRPENMDGSDGPIVSDELFLWETHIKALGIRKVNIPNSNDLKPSFLDWILLQRGTSAYGLEAEMFDWGFWSGRVNVTTTSDTTTTKRTEERPDSMESIYSNNMGGWMASRQQLWEWHSRLCLGGFLPPFNEPTYALDGMNKVVEYWSGGGNLYGRMGCNLQRIIPFMDPQEFSRHLLYHTPNNKQKQLKFVKGLFSHVDTFLGQLHTVQKEAERVMQSEKGRQHCP